MNEDIIVQQVKQNIPARPEETVTIPAPSPAVDEQSSFVENAVSELGMLKLGNQLGLEYQTEDTTEKLKYIYTQLSEVSGGTSYDDILNTLNDYLTRLGLTYREDRFTKLFLYFKLNQERTAIDREMAQL